MRNVSSILCQALYGVAILVWLFPVWVPGWWLPSAIVSAVSATGAVILARRINAEGPEFSGLRELPVPWRLALIFGWLGFFGFNYWARNMHLGAWLDALPFAYQIPAKIALILLYLVVPFALLVYFAGSRKDVARP